MTSSDSSLDAALRDRTLMSKYCHGIDKHDEGLFISIWADDGYELPREPRHRRDPATGPQGLA